MRRKGRPAPGRFALAERRAATLAVSVSPAPSSRAETSCRQSSYALAYRRHERFAKLELEITELDFLPGGERGALRCAYTHGFATSGSVSQWTISAPVGRRLAISVAFRFDKIKIGQSFIRDLPTKEDSVAIVRGSRPRRWS